MNQELLFTLPQDKEAKKFFTTTFFDLPNSAQFHTDTLQKIFVKSLPSKKSIWMQKISQANLIYIYDLLQDRKGANDVIKNINSFSWMKPYAKTHKLSWLRKCITRFASKLVIETKRFEKLDKKNKEDSVVITEPKLTEQDVGLEDKVSGLGNLQWTIRCLTDYIVKIGKEKELQNSLGVTDLNYIKALETTGKLCKELVTIQHALVPSDGNANGTNEAKKITITVNNTIQAIIENSDRKDKMTKATITLLSNLQKDVICIPDEQLLPAKKEVIDG